MKLRTEIFIFFFIFFVSCRTKQLFFISRTQDQKIKIINDSTLNYSASQGGGIGYLINYKFVQKEKSIFIKKNYSDTIRYLNNDGIYDVKNINNQIFVKTKDSIINISNGMIFYEEKYHEKKELSRTVYYVVDNEKFKVSPKSTKKFFLNGVTTDNYDISIMPQEQALKEFNINQNYRTFIFKKKKSSM